MIPPLQRAGNPTVCAQTAQSTPALSVMARFVRATPTRTQSRQIPRTSPTPPVTAHANQAPTP
jgi:hypothetical protein